MTGRPIRLKPSKTRSRRNKQTTCGAASAVPPSLSNHSIQGRSHCAGLSHFWRNVMTEIQPIPGSSPDFDAWAANDQQRKQLSDELLPVNKAALFEALLAAGIDTVAAKFDGCGDSGQIEEIDVRRGDTVVELPTTTIEIATPVWGTPDVLRKSCTIFEAIEHFVYALLEDTHSGWEDSDGAFGDFTFNVPERTIKLEYNERYTEITHSEHEF